MGEQAHQEADSLDCDMVSVISLISHVRDVTSFSSLDWHPNNILLAAGSTDFKTRSVHSSVVISI